MKLKSFWEKTKEYLKIALKELIRSIKLLPIYILSVFILLIILKYLPNYLITNFKPSLLGNSETVTYFCTVIASFVTISGVFLTLKHNQKLVKDQLKQSEDRFNEERRYSILPIITVEDSSNSYPNIDDKSLILFIENGTRNFPYTLSDKHKEIIKGIFEFRLEGEVYIANQKGVYRQFTFTNSGIGTAVNLTLTLYEYDKDIKYWVCMTPVVNLKPMQSINFTIFSDDIVHLKEEYFLELNYKDIYTNTYKQEYKFSVFRSSYYTAMDYTVEQHLIIE